MNAYETFLQNNPPCLGATEWTLALQLGRKFYNISHEPFTIASLEDVYSALDMLYARTPAEKWNKLLIYLILDEILPAK